MSNLKDFLENVRKNSAKIGMVAMKQVCFLSLRFMTTTSATAGAVHSDIYFDAIRMYTQYCSFGLHLKVLGLH